jgi:hypothetical protein
VSGSSEAAPHNGKTEDGLAHELASTIKKGKRAQRSAARRTFGPWADFILAMEQIHAPALLAASERERETEATTHPSGLESVDEDQS